MVNFLRKPPCSRIALMVAMETMHFFHSAIEFIFEDKNSLHFWGPNERFGTHEKLSWGGGGGGCKVGQISSRGRRPMILKLGVKHQ